jgi:hypothetical protein
VKENKKKGKNEKTANQRKKTEKKGKRKLRNTITEGQGEK